MDHLVFCLQRPAANGCSSRQIAPMHAVLQSVSFRILQRARAKLQQARCNKPLFRPGLIAASAASRFVL